MNKNKKTKINWYSKIGNNALNKCSGDFNRPHFEGITKNKSGITIVTLVITIVLMLILAGAAVSIFTDGEDAINTAENATKQWNNRITAEDEALQGLLAKRNEILGGKTDNDDVSVPNILPAGWDSTKVADVVTETSTIAGVEKERKAPIPMGYTKSGITSEINANSPEDTIAGGMVVYQIPDGATVDWAENEITLSGEEIPINLQENVNQYVWIPVDDINDMVMCKYNTKTTKIDGTAIDGEDGICELDYNVTTPNEITCKTHGFNTTGYDTTAKVLAKTDIDTVGLAGRVYDVPTTSSPTKKETTEDNKNIYTLTPSFKKDTTFSANSGYREPAIVTGNSSGTGTSYDGAESNLTGIGDGTVATFKAQLNKDFIEMAKSVAKYGGFYISRYEPSYDSEKEKVISKKNQKVLTAKDTATDTVNYLAGNKWYGLYNKTLNNVEKDESVNSHMIWGCQYDQVIEFLGDKAEVGHLYQTTKQEKTGYDKVENGNPVVDQDILNNIYDLEGNNSEWTAQAIGTNVRVVRGGNYFFASNSSFFPASRRGNYNPASTDSLYYTTRPTLYVK